MKDKQLKGYYMKGSAEALYSQTGNKTAIRKSYTTEGTELAGDDNGYPQNWDEDLKKPVSDIR